MILFDENSKYNLKCLLQHWYHKATENIHFEWIPFWKVLKGVGKLFQKFSDKKSKQSNHIFGMKNLVKVLGGQEAETGAGFAQGDIFGVGELCGLGGVFVSDMRVEGGNKH